jgi:predicted SprT family Zn-dependent metalloprotease
LQNKPSKSSSRLQKQICSWGQLWKTPNIENRIQVVFDPRLSRSLGCSDTRKKIIRLNVGLKNVRRKELLEVVCHEAAHIAVVEIYGNVVRPHGFEWQHLMRLAGFAPTTSIRLKRHQHQVRSAEKRELTFEHRCPVCQMMRLARRAVKGWKCAACIRAGLDGHLIITKRANQVAESD